MQAIAWAILGGALTWLLLFPSRMGAEPVDVWFECTPASGAPASYDYQVGADSVWTTAGSFLSTAATEPCQNPANAGQQCHRFSVSVERGTPFTVRTYAVNADGVPGPMSQLSEVVVAGEQDTAPGSIGAPGQLYYIIPAAP